ncbi:5'-nucleotidase [Melaminivora alkalimesophila]|uniref:5'-nucleotidase n=3 Tax=Melaminivora alkalimesophila TaxID=1165852 RepID=A0A317RHE1_9BURK|nr:5'-nucleotidase [Melaminivora alkalimesophila]
MVMVTDPGARFFSWCRQRAGSAAALALAVLLAACAGPRAIPEAGGDGAFRLTILHLNDHHSNLQPRAGTVQLDDGSGQRVPVAMEVGGYARVVSALEELSAAAGPNVLRLHAGDALTGTLYFNRAGEPGEADAALMDVACFDAFTLGNHEFDKGDSALRGFVERLGRGRCPTPVLSANVRFGAQSALHPSRAPDMVRPSVVLRRGGQDIGIVGVTVAYKTKVSSSPDADTQFDDEAAAVQREIDRLQARGIDKIIVLSHIGHDADLRLARGLRGVDVIVGGDSHTLLGPAAMVQAGIGTPTADYPVRMRGVEGQQVCVVQAAEFSQVLGELQLSFDARGELLSCEGTAHILVGQSMEVDGRTPAPGLFERLEASRAAAGFLRVTRPSAAAQAALAPFEARVAGFARTRVASVPQELCARRVPGGPDSMDYGRSSGACNAEGRVSQHGGDIQQLVAQAYLDVARLRYGGADVAVQNGGGVRTPLVGVVTAEQLIGALPFGNTLWRLDVTGAELKDMLEDGMEAVWGPGGSSGPYPYAAGLRFSVDATRARGERIAQLEVHDPESDSWRPIDPARLYRLFVPQYVARGGDGNPTLAAVPPERRLDIGVLDTDLFMDWIEQQPRDPATGLPVLKRLPLSSYSTQRFTDQQRSGS